MRSVFFFLNDNQSNTIYFQSRYYTPLYIALYIISVMESSLLIAVEYVVSRTVGTIHLHTWVKWEDKENWKLFRAHSSVSFRYSTNVLKRDSCNDFNGKLYHLHAATEPLKWCRTQFTTTTKTIIGFYGYRITVCELIPL